MNVTHNKFVYVACVSRKKMRLTLLKFDHYIFAGFVSHRSWIWRNSCGTAENGVGRLEFADAEGKAGIYKGYYLPFQFLKWTLQFLKYSLKYFLFWTAQMPFLWWNKINNRAHKVHFSENLKRLLIIIRNNNLLKF